MNASKENARIARRYFEQMSLNLDKDKWDDCDKFVWNFLEAAERKLPTEAAFKRDKERRAKIV